MFLNNASQLKNGPLHMSHGGVKAPHLIALLTGRLAGVNRPRIDQNEATGQGKMFDAVMGEGLEPPRDQTDHVIVVAVARKGMIDVKSLQKPDVKMIVMP